MAKETIAKVHGKYYTYEIIEETSVWSSPNYKIYKNDKYVSSHSSRADAIRKAHELAGPDSYES